jgi:hypothetical protein
MTSASGNVSQSSLPIAENSIVKVIYDGPRVKNPFSKHRYSHELNCNLGPHLKAEVTAGDPILIFLYSLALLILGCAIGIRWGATWSALRVAFIGAALMIIHDWILAVILLWRAAKSARSGRFNRVRW